MINNKNIQQIFLLLIGIVSVYIIYRITTKKNKTISQNKIIKENLPHYQKLKKMHKNNPTISSIEKEIIPPRIKPNFINVMFHNDYRDVMTAINNMVPSNKQIFNVSNRPLKYSEPSEKEVIDLVSQFIDNLNNEIKAVPDVRNNNTGWDESLPDNKVLSGWEKQRKSLGLETSVHPEPLGKTNVDLVDIRKIQKYEIENEVKYSIVLILEKEEADDQIMIKVSFVVDKTNLVDENNFFIEDSFDVRVFIEDISIEGFFSDYGQDMIKQYELTKSKDAEFKMLENQNIMSDQDIMNELGRQYEKRIREMEMRTSTLDEYGRDVHYLQPDIMGFAAINSTQTIEDDLLNKNRIFV